MSKILLMDGRMDDLKPNKNFTTHFNLKYLGFTRIQFISICSEKKLNNLVDTLIFFFIILFKIQTTSSFSRPAHQRMSLLCAPLSKTRFHPSRRPLKRNQQPIRIWSIWTSGQNTLQT